MIPLMKESGGPVWFGVIWTLLAVSGALIGAYNLFSEEGIATDEFSYTSERLPRTKGIQSRLRELNELKAQGLISDAEYQSKRSELLGKI